MLAVWMFSAFSSYFFKTSTHWPLFRAPKTISFTEGERSPLCSDDPFVLLLASIGEGDGGESMRRVGKSFFGFRKYELVVDEVDEHSRGSIYLRL